MCSVSDLHFIHSTHTLACCAYFMANYIPWHTVALMSIPIASMVEATGSSDPATAPAPCCSCGQKASASAASTCRSFGSSAGSGAAFLGAILWTPLVDEGTCFSGPVQAILSDKQMEAVGLLPAVPRGNHKSQYCCSADMPSVPCLTVVGD